MKHIGKGLRLKSTRLDRLTANDYFKTPELHVMLTANHSDAGSIDSSVQISIRTANPLSNETVDQT